MCFEYILLKVFEGRITKLMDTLKIRKSYNFKFIMAYLIIVLLKSN